MSSQLHTDEEIVAAYLQNQATRDDSLFWAFTELNELVSDDPERAWTITLMLIKRSTDELALAYVAAGPLEDLLAYHGQHFIERVEEQSKVNARFLEALQCVCGESRFAPDVYVRVQQAIR